MDGAASTWSHRLRRRAASPYTAGPSLVDALHAARRLKAAGLGAVLGYGAAPQEQPRAVMAQHRAVFTALHGDDLDAYVSVKLSALGYSTELFHELGAAAAESGRRLHLDAVAPDGADAARRLLEEAAKSAPLGTTLPGRWASSVEDADRASALGVAVRVVKGQWRGGADDRDPAEGVLAVVDRLCGHRGGVSIATHDVPLLHAAVDRLVGSGTPCDVELFLGPPFRPPAETARRLGVPIRVYVPFGDAGTPYRRGELLRRPATAWWLAKDVLLGAGKSWRGIEGAAAP